MGFPWRIITLVIIGRPTFKIKKLLGKQTYELKHKSKQASTNWIAQKWGDIIISDPNLAIATVGDLVMREFGIKIPTYTLYRAKQIALFVLNKKHAGDFGRPKGYIQELT